MASKLKGVAAVRRMVRRLPESVAKEIVSAFQRWGRELAARMRAGTPVRTGALIAKIGFKVFPRTLRLQVGLIASKRERQRLFYGRILDLGRKGRTVRARRRTKTGGVSSYAMNVGPIRAKHFVTGPMTDLRAGLRRYVHGIYDRALRRAAAGGGE